ncbi:MAG: type II toxin-antitoxin system RelE/ParE family toxin [Candidatus Cloacimonetes bacterium]|nr:type II toxin-antitoxin system RelE/ParE family toxin [Candidatus Cloacimonadota bacterium]
MLKIQFLPSAQKELEKIDKIWQKKIKKNLQMLSENPALIKNKIKKLKDKYKDYFRLRVGNYRIIFRVEKKKLIILVLRITHRKEIYKIK